MTGSMDLHVVGGDPGGERQRLTVGTLDVVTFGRSRSGAALWCGTAAWISAEAGRLIHRNGHWWLENPRRSASETKRILRYEHDDGRVDVTVRGGGSAELPGGAGRSVLVAPPEDGRLITIRIRTRAGDAPEPRPLMSGRTESVRPSSVDTVDVLAVMTWPLRYLTGLRLLNVRETAEHLGLQEDTVRKRLRSYRDQLVEAFNWKFQSNLPEQLGNLAITLDVIQADDDERVLRRWGPPELPRRDP
jgi:hypothetical protein